MKLLVALVELLLFSSLDDAPKNSNSIKNQICNTWVAYEVVTSEPMMQRKSVIKINKADKYRYDSLQINKDGSYYRYFHQNSFSGNWKMNADSTELFILPSSPVRRNRGWPIIFSSDSLLHLRYSWGKEGESSIFKYKPLKGAKN